jgi:hypothetical protein
VDECFRATYCLCLQSRLSWRQRQYVMWRWRFKPYEMWHCVIRPGVHDDLKGRRVFRTLDCMLNNTASHPKRWNSQASCLGGSHISHSYKLPDSRIVAFSYHSTFFLTVEMLGLLEGIYRWWDLNWKHVLTISITVHIQSLIIYYGCTMLVSWWSHQAIVSALTNRNSRSE